MKNSKKKANDNGLRGCAARVFTECKRRLRCKRAIEVTAHDFVGFRRMINAALRSLADGGYIKFVGYVPNPSGRGRKAPAYKVAR